MSHALNLIGASISKHNSVKQHLDEVLELINIIARNKPLAKAIVEAGWWEGCQASTNPLVLYLCSH